MPDFDTAIPLMTGARYVATNLSSPQRIELAIELIEANLYRAPGYAFDLAKSLIETTCFTILKECGQEAERHPEVHQLAKATLAAVLRVPDGHPDPKAARDRLETAFRGLVSVVLGIGSLRNLDGEIGHGKEADRIGLARHHAEFAVRAADAVVKSLFECHQFPKSSTNDTDGLTYSENASFNDYVDDLHQPISILSGQYKPSEVLFQMDRQTYRDALADFALENGEETQ